MNVICSNLKNSLEFNISVTALSNKMRQENINYKIVYILYYKCIHWK